MVRKFLVVCALIVSTACAGNYKPITKPYAQQRTEASIEALRDEKGFIHCTTFSINERDHLWMTAHHCIVAGDGTPDSPLQYNLPYIGWEKTTLIKDFPEWDVAILRTEKASAPALHLSRVPVYEQDPVYIMGHGLGWESVTTFYGTVANLLWAPQDDHAYTVFQISCWPGHSGSPVLNGATNYVESVVQVGWRVGAACAGIPLSDLQRETGSYWEK